MQAVAATIALCFWSGTAYLTFSQAVVLRSRPILIFATACFFVALLDAPYLVAFPGVMFEHGIGNADAAAWLSWLGLAIFATLVAAYVHSLRVALKPWRRGEGRRYARAAAVIAVALTVVALTPGLLPVLTHGGAYTAVGRGLLYGLAALYIGVLAYTALVTRGHTVLNLWLIVTLVAMTADAFMTASGGALYTVGWYVSRFERAFAPSMLLFVFLLDFTTISRRLATLASLDAVSGLANRRSLDERLDLFVRNHRRRGDCLSVLMLDIDHFKDFNDRYGHAAGDEALRAVADVVRRALGRGTDFAARYGGEEFVVVLPGTDRSGALVVAERIRGDIERIAVAGSKRASQVTVSIGAVTLAPHTVTSAERVLRGADAALYVAKAAGRNRVAEAHDGVTGGSNASTA
jgi:diguanylate cyclase (GGDEF)-like protein